MGYIIVCRAENADRWEYVPATRRIWQTEESANRYASTIHPDRYPRVLSAEDYLMAYEGWRQA